MSPENEEPDVRTTDSPSASPGASRNGGPARSAPGRTDGPEEPTGPPSAQGEQPDVKPEEEPEEDPPFPVLKEEWLPYVPGKFMRGARRDPDDLPKALPGTILVFRAGARYVAFDSHKHLTGKEDYVVDATAVCLVDMRVRSFTVMIPIPSASAAADFTIRATFQARVTNAEKAAEEGSIDVRGFIEEYLAKDPKLLGMGTFFYLEDIKQVRDQVTSRIEAYCELRPIRLPGLSITLTSSGVLTPGDLRTHEQRLQDERWQQQFKRLHAVGEDEEIRRQQRFVHQGSGALTAVGLARGETPVNDAINNAREDEQRQQEQIAEAFRILQRSGALDYMDINPTEMANVYLERLTGQRVRPSRRRKEVREQHVHGALAPGIDDLDDEDGDEDDDFGSGPAGQNGP